MAKLFELEALAAKHGDALLLHYGTTAKPRLIVIDGGPGGVWAKALSPRLDDLRAERGDPLEIRMLMVSHVDDDHIRGVLDMTQRMSNRLDDSQPAEYSIDEIWFNAFDDVLGNSQVAAIAQPSAAASLSGSLQSAGALIASVGQGRRLRDRIRHLGLEQNGGDPLIVAGWDWDIGDGLTFTIVGPLQSEIDAFQTAWDKEVRAKGWDANVAAAEVAAYLDKSAWNLASLVVLAECHGKRMLLTGDARGDHILAGLAEQGLSDASGIDVDVLKVPHHGSDRNVSPEFFEAVRADHYVISGNGEHHNPEIATLRMILDARGSDSYEIHCTYRKGVDGFSSRMTAFLGSLSAAQRSRFVFRAESALSLVVAP
jgi:hypothetical protein